VRGWGESGYMRIKWTVNGVGTSANYVVYGGTYPPTETPVSGNTATPVPTGTTPSTLTPTATLQPTTPGATATPVADVLGPGTYDDTDQHLNYSGQWYLYQGNGPANGTVHYSNASGNAVSFAFDGVRFSVGFTGHYSRGVMYVTIDNTTVTLFNEFRWQLKWQQVWNSPVFSAGVHQVTIQHFFGSQTDIDFIKITGP